MPQPGKRQTLMFSATFAPEVQKLARQFLVSNYIFVAVGLLGSANRDISQVVLRVEKTEKKDKLLELLDADITGYKQKMQANGSFEKKTLVFVQTKINADFLATLISRKGLPATSMHGYAIY